MTTVFRLLTALLLVVLPLASVQAQKACEPGTDYFAEASTLLDNFQYDEAIAAATCGLEFDSDDGTLYALRGMSYYYQGYYDDAILDLTQADMLFPRVPVINYHLAMAYYSTQKNREAIEHFTAVLEYAANTPDEELFFTDTYVYRGWSKFELEQYEDAISDFKRALDIDPDGIQALYGRGVMYANMRQYQSAMSDFDRLVTLVPEAENTFFQLGNVTVMVGEYAELVADVSAANVSLQLNPNYAEGYRLRGVAHLELGELEEAIADLSVAVERDPQDAEAYFQRGTTHYFNEAPELALQDYSRAIEIDPTNAEYYSSRASVHQDLHDYEHAIADSTRLIELEPDSPDGYLLRGFSHSMNGEYVEAGADFMEWADRIESETIDGGLLTLSETQVIEMAQGSVFRFQFEGEAGDHLQVSAVSTIPSMEIDSLIIILDSDGNPLTGEDDDVPYEGFDDDDYDLDAVIEDFEVPDDGTYTLVVTHAGGNNTGEVNVLVEKSAGVVNPT
jgi:tetratricopeptide (TPR) repeat protein